MMLANVIEFILTILFVVIFVLAGVFITYLNLFCKEEIWSAIYERMGWYE